MRIRMYECGFGDCYRIEYKSGKKKHLFVDCGIHALSWSDRDRASRYKGIEKDISKRASFLLTHYHSDHYSGAISMSKRFKDIYIPDVWSFTGSVKVIKLLLMEEFSKKNYVTKTLTLFDFLKKLCYSTVHFVKRGDVIDSSFVALWPKPGNLLEEADEFFDHENIPYSVDERLEQIATKIDEVVLAISTLDDTQDRALVNIERHRLIGRIYYYEREWHKLYEANIDTLEPFIEAKKETLASFGNRVSIVFQDINNDDHLLFTGDFCNVTETGLWNYIESNFDGLVDMHEKYWVIKIPHHGTKAYYHDFKPRMTEDTIMLIPNGIINKKWHICKEYNDDANSSKCKTVCSLNCACEGCLRRGLPCSCSKHNIIYPAAYLDF